MTKERTDKTTQATIRWMIPMVLLFLLPSIALCQKLTGSVRDHTGKPLPLANIIVAGEVKGTFSGADGNFELAINRKTAKVILISHIGYRSIDVQIPPSNRVDVNLDPYYEPLTRINLDLFPKSIDPDTEIDSSDPLNSKTAIETYAVPMGGWDFFLNAIGNSLTKAKTQKDFIVEFTVNDKGIVDDLKFSDSIQVSPLVLLQTLRTLPGFVAATQRQKPVAQHFQVAVGHGYTQDEISKAERSFYSYLLNTIEYPIEARKSGTQGYAYVSFKIDPEGRITESRIVADPGHGCGEEVRIIVSMTPRITANQFAATKGSNFFVLPVAFGLGKPFAGEAPRLNTSGTVLEALSVVGMLGETPKGQRKGKR